MRPFPCPDPECPGFMELIEETDAGRLEQCDTCLEAEVY